MLWAPLPLITNFKELIMDQYCDCGAIVDGECACMMEATESLSSWGILDKLLE
jgi:hypothetical protein